MNRIKRFRSEEEVEFHVESGEIGLQDPIEYHWHDELFLATPGRVIFGARSSGRSMRRSSVTRRAHTFINRTLSKRGSTPSSAGFVDRYGAHAIASVLDTIQGLAFRYATKAGITISKNDIVIPPRKEEILSGYETRCRGCRGAVRARTHHRGRAPRVDRRRLDGGDRRGRRRDAGEPERAELDLHDGQLGSTRIVQADPPARRHARSHGESEGRDHERPIKANFMEGLSVLEYFISTHGARKGLAARLSARPTRLPYAAARRRLAGRDHPRGRLRDRGAVELAFRLPDGMNESVIGRILAEDVRSRWRPASRARRWWGRRRSRGARASARSQRRSRTTRPSCGAVGAESAAPPRAYLGRLGTFLATSNVSDIGDTVGGIAAQSIGEPGTRLDDAVQFHTGGAGQQHGARPARVHQDLRGTRNPKGATLAEISGKVDIDESEGPGPKITRVTPTRASTRTARRWNREEYQLPRRTRLLVTKGQILEPGDTLNDGSRAPAELLELHTKAGKGTTEQAALVGEVQEDCTVAGRGRPRRAHRADRPPDAEEGEGEGGRRDLELLPGGLAPDGRRSSGRTRTGRRRRSWQRSSR